MRATSRPFYGMTHAQYLIESKPPKPRRLNDDDRRQWILNQWALYTWFKSSRQSMKMFIRTNRGEIDRAINTELDRKPGN